MENINQIKIVCISDTNNVHEGLQTIKGDILIHCGDFTKSGTEGEFYAFLNFLDKLQFKHKIVIAGHKEMTFDTEKYQCLLRKIFHNNFPQYDGQIYKNQLRGLQNVYYLEHESIQIEGIKIFGSPYQPLMFDCAFGRESQQLKKIWEPISQPVDILITHCPPNGILDDYKGGKTGCSQIKKKISELRPKYHIFGHNRDQHGILQQEGTTFVSCCRFDNKFKPTNPPIEFYYSINN